MNWFKEFKITTILAIVNPFAFLILCFFVGIISGNDEAARAAGGAVGSIWGTLMFLGTIIWGLVALIIGIAGNWVWCRQWVVWATVSFAGFLLLALIGTIL